MPDYILCHIQARHAEQRRQMASEMLAEELLLPLWESGEFLALFKSIYGPLLVSRPYKLRTRVMLDLFFQVEFDDD